MLKSQIPGIICSEEISYLLFDYCCLLIVHLLISRNESVKSVQALSIQFEGFLLVCLFMVLDLLENMRKNMKDCDLIVILNISFKESEF